MPCGRPARPPEEIQRGATQRRDLRRSLRNNAMNEQIKSVRDLASEEFDTRTLLRNAVDQAIERHYEDFFIVDVDSHLYETESFKEITQYMDNPVMRQEALYQGMSRGGITSPDGSYQEIGGRHTPHPPRQNERRPPSPPPDNTPPQRFLDAMGTHATGLFPPP